MAGYLEINGIQLQQEQLETYRFVIDLYTEGRSGCLIRRIGSEFTRSL